MYERNHFLIDQVTGSWNLDDAWIEWIVMLENWYGEISRQVLTAAY